MLGLDARKLPFGWIPALVDAPDRRWKPRALHYATMVLMCCAILAFAVDMQVTRSVAGQGLPGDVHKSIMIAEVFAHGFGVACILLAVWVLDPGRRSWVGFLMVCSFGSALLVHPLKQTIARSRPSASDLTVGVGDTFVGWFASLTREDAGSHLQSFPSGHSATAVGLALGLSFVYPRGRWLFLFFAALACFQRVAASAHFLSDVLAGASLGCLTALVAQQWQARQDRARRRRAFEV